MSESRYEVFPEKIFAVEDKFDISMDVQKFILQVCWAQHDAQWFLKSKRKFEIEKANELNQEVLFSMGKIEARHVLNALNIQKYSVKSILNIFKIMNTFMYVFFPEVMEFRLISLSESEGVGVVYKCYIWEEVKRSKGEAEYKCACNARHRGWLEALGVKAKILPVKRLPDGDDSCEFRFILPQSGDVFDHARNNVDVKQLGTY
jgi:hypothetical protein